MVAHERAALATSIERVELASALRAYDHLAIPEPLPAAHAYHVGQTDPPPTFGAQEGIVILDEDRPALAFQVQRADTFTAGGAFQVLEKRGRAAIAIGLRHRLDILLRPLLIAYGTEPRPSETYYVIYLPAVALSILKAHLDVSHAHRALQVLDLRPDDPDGRSLTVP
jgi:hypothetical protein